MVFFVHDNRPRIDIDILEGVFIVLEYFFVEDIVDIAWNIRAKMPGYEYPAFLIKNVKG